jgi:hypothetical protein
MTRVRIEIQTMGDQQRTTFARTVELDELPDALADLGKGLQQTLLEIGDLPRLPLTILLLEPKA